MLCASCKTETTDLCPVCRLCPACHSPASYKPQIVEAIEGRRTGDGRMDDLPIEAWWQDTGSPVG